MNKLANWLDEHSPAESIDICKELALSHAHDSGIYADYLVSLIHGDRLRELCEFEINYEVKGLTARAVRNARQAVAFFSKNSALNLGVDREKVAWLKFLEAEAVCSSTNEIFRKRRTGDVTLHPRVESALLRAQRQIARVLGDLPSLEDVDFRFGSGATTSTPKRMASIRAKVRDGVACSEELFPAAAAVLAELPALVEVVADSFVREDNDYQASVPVQIHDGILTFVPKNWKTDRSVMTEPVLNGLYQLAFGDYITRRLAQFGLNLRDQTRNQRLALMGSLSGEYATVDLSSASDTIAYELVFDLLPLEWAHALARGRTGHCLYKGIRLTLGKFSSMGNGFTFPLESLIFWSLACAVCSADETVNVYGDDIIVPTHRYAELFELLRVCGFTVNRDKSYHTGPFRESCGKDYFRGIDVRPFYQKELISPRTLFVLHNYYVRNLDDERAKWVSSLIHPALKLFGPDGYGDGHLVTEHFARTRTARLRSRGYGGYCFDTYVMKGQRDITADYPGDSVLPPYSVYRRSAEDLSPSLIGLSEPSLPIPEGTDGSKELPLPSDVDMWYKRVSIYTLGV